VTSVTQSGGTWSWGYGTSYTYNAAGERERATYDTPAGVTTWEYRDYIRVGDPTKGARVFQTLRKLDGGGNGTSEEMHYVFDSAGRLRNAMFAQRPQTGTGTPTSAPYYTSGYPAASRAISYYDYDPSGRTVELSHGWQTWNGSAYSTPTVIFQNGAAYDSYKGLETSSTFYAPSAPAGFNRTETYGYEAERDFLTSASYGDGLPNANPTWTYDASQNRSNSGYAYDALNRMTASPDGWSYAHDPVGNRLNRTKPNGDYAVYEWDALNRMTRYFDQPRTTYTNYEYRPDGLRAHKAQDRPGQATLHESSRYDGQMPFEQARYQEGGSATITRSGLGARGIDVEEVKTGTYNSSTGFTLGSWSTPSYPLYDAHGNRVCALTRSGTNSYATDAPRTYDAWGQIRSGATQNGSPSRYCANLGHVQDDESGLVYMRTRFYEPGTGRFISQDPMMDGGNWYTYAGNDPVTFVDATGGAKEIKMNSRAALAARGSAIGYFIYFTGTFIASLGDDKPWQKFAAHAVASVVALGTAQYLTMTDTLFPILNKVATAFANAFPGEGKGGRASAYLDFWIGYGMFLGLVLDGINAIDSYSGRESPWS
jgi:RHS repeat-associated protein